MPADKTFTSADVAKHNTEKDCMIIVDGVVYDVTSFLSEHPGGKKVLLQVAGQDASKKFHLFHKPSVLTKYGPKLAVGKVGSGGGADESGGAQKKQSESPAPKKVASESGGSAAKADKPAAKKPSETASTDDAASAKSSKSKSPSSPPASPYSGGVLNSHEFGELVPYGDPSWYQGWHSPHFKPHHLQLRQAIRDFVEAEIMPNCHDWDEAKSMPKDIFSRMAKGGWLAGVAGTPWPTEYVGNHVGGGIQPEQFDVWCELILCDEISRCGSGGVVWGLFGGLSIGLPPVRHYGSPELKKKVVGPCLRGEKCICLAITEPYAGSDVANIQCEAKKTEDGKHYIVNGEKKWITNGVFADFFTVAVRTGGKGMKGISLLLIERGPGVTTKQMNCQGVWSSGTTYITFEDVKVPVGNLIGKENEGFRVIMGNFNHERWSICVQSARFARVCLEESMRYAFKRKTFGKLLIEHPVIRLKLAHMARQVEATWALIESITYQMSVMTPAEQNRTLGGSIALCKAQSTTVFEYCAREAAQIFGGAAYTRGGQGEKVERLYREVRAFAIPGGSEEIMLDLGVRMAIKPYKKRLQSKA